MKKIIIIIALAMVSLQTFCQESNNGKQLWANSFLNKKAPNLLLKNGFPPSQI